MVTKYQSGSLYVKLILCAKMYEKIARIFMSRITVYAAGAIKKIRGEVQEGLIDPTFVTMNKIALKMLQKVD